MVEKYIVGDDRVCLANLLVHALSHCQLDHLTGGLGPTEDDITRDSVAAALGRTQYFSPEVCDGSKLDSDAWGGKMVEVNRRRRM